MAMHRVATTHRDQQVPVTAYDIKPLTFNKNNGSS